MKNFAAALKTLHGSNTFLVTYLVLQSPWLPVQVRGSLHASPSERKIQVHFTSPMNLSAEGELLPRVKYQEFIVI